MAYLTREQYDRRRENAEERNARNEVIAATNGMSEHEAELISELCRIRHNMHCNIEHLVHDSSYDGIEKEIVQIIAEIGETNLPEVNIGKYYSSLFDDCLNIDDFELLFETEKVPEGDTEREEWYEENYSRIYNDWSALNDIIEKYLRNEIDKKYGTSFAPTGTLRML